MKKWISALFLVVMLVVSGCVSSSVNPGGKPGGNNGDPNPGVKLIQGQVVFEGVEGLGLWSEKVIIDNQVVSTDDHGRFTINQLDPGVYEYAIHNLLGTHTAELTYNGEDSITLVYPVFDGWDWDVYKEILFVIRDSEAAARWDRGKSLKVWIEPIDNYPELDESFVNRAWDAIFQWRDILGSNIIDVMKVDKKEDANFVWVWDYDIDANGRCYIHYSFASHIVYFAEVIISPSVIGKWSDGDHIDDLNITRLFLHEVGHCLGLAHSPNPDHVMSDRRRSINEHFGKIHEEEKKYINLLYSTDPKNIKK